MTDPYEYQDWLGVLYEQLPHDLQTKLKIAVVPGAFGDRGIAMFIGPDGRSEQFPIQEDGRIAENAVAQLCVTF
jgi:hypothetical protein